MDRRTLNAGAAQRVITPPVGVSLSGWNPRASGDIRSRYVHDDLYARALVLRNGSRAWAQVAVDLTGVDAVATEQIRAAAADRTGLSPDTIMVCATHTHSGPAFCPVATAYSPEDMARLTIRADGSAPAAMGRVTSVSSSASWVGETDLEWKAWLVAQAVEAVEEAHGALRPASAGFGEARIDGVASSRRVLMSDGNWGDPRREPVEGVRVVSRTSIDPLVRVFAVREQGTEAPLAAVINYGTHPWIFCGSGISAEIAGAASDRVANSWRRDDGAPPVVLYTSGPEGDVTPIWNVDIEGVWRTRPGENPEASLARRESGFDGELTRLGGRVAEGAMAAIRGIVRRDGDPELWARRKEVALPLKEGYRHVDDVILADWQREAPECHHLTEVQALGVGEGVFLGLPGEPFVSLGTDIRARSGSGWLLIAALANEFGAVSYIAEREAFEQGGYETAFTPVGPGGGEALVDGAVALLDGHDAR
ncbi:MAG: hypothetical protein OXH06_12150 [Gemmatimonadetes bacterium]|nr:hypothetical protein [Gemmatimonadota bacterium]MDE3259948.1 hypothetical protein [Gemmatimonadota bacterium]